MNIYVLDTSVAVAWYLDETFSVSARTWQDRLLRGTVTLVVPSLHYWEFANVLRSLVHRHELAASLAREIYDLHIDAPLEKAEPDEWKVLDVALEYNATVYDAVYLALCIARQLTLLTAEKTTTPWVAKFRDRISLVK